MWPPAPPTEPRSRSVAVLIAVLGTIVLLAVGCSSSSEPTAARTDGTSAARGTSATITVAAAASLTGPFTTIGDDFMAAHPGATVIFTFDSSGTLSKQLIDGAPADVFASADPTNMTKLTDLDLIEGEPEVFARNQLAIVVKAGNPTGITSLADLAQGGTIALCGTEVPCGAYAERILARAGVAIAPDRITRGQNVKATLAAVSEGDADAGIVYLTDIAGDAVEAVTIPTADNEIATYPIGILAGTADRATTEAFMAYVLSDAGQAVLGAAGFLPAS